MYTRLSNADIFCGMWMAASAVKSVYDPLSADYLYLHFALMNQLATCIAININQKLVCCF